MLGAGRPVERALPGRVIASSHHPGSAVTGNHALDNRMIAASRRYW